MSADRTPEARSAAVHAYAAALKQQNHDPRTRDLLVIGFGAGYDAALNGGYQRILDAINDLPEDDA